MDMTANGLAAAELASHDAWEGVNGEGGGREGEGEEGEGSAMEVACPVVPRGGGGGGGRGGASTNGGHTCMRMQLCTMSFDQVRGGGKRVSWEKRGNGRKRGNKGEETGKK